MDAVNEIYLMGKNIVYKVFIQDQNFSELTEYAVNSAGILEKKLCHNMLNCPDLKSGHILNDRIAFATALQLMLTIDNPQIRTSVADSIGYIIPLNKEGIA